MHCSRADFSEKQVKNEDDKLFTKKLVSNETSPSFRVYYGDHVPSAVPFTWETIPGTPKHLSSHEYNYSHIPPLTPPPSYYNNLNNSSKNNPRSKHLIHNLLRRMNPKNKKSNFESPSHSSLSSLSWSSSAHSSSSDPISDPKRRRFSSWGGGTSFHAKSVGSLRAVACCFGIRNDNGERIIQSGYSIFIVKKALLSIVGRGSA